MADQNKPKIDRKGRQAKAAVAQTAVGIVEAAKAAPSAVADAVSEALSAPAQPTERKPAEPKPVAPQPAVAEPAAAVEAPAVAEKIIESSVNTTESGASTMTETINNTINKAQEATQQAAQQTAEQFRGAVSQANERGQAAMEKGARFVEEMADLTRGNLEALVASQKTAAKFVESLTQSAADYSRRSFEEASTAFRSFAEAKSPTDIFRLQSDFARNAFDSMISESARVSETVVKMTGEVAEPITSRYSVAAERLKAVAA